MSFIRPNWLIRWIGVTVTFGLGVKSCEGTRCKICDSLGTPFRCTIILVLHKVKLANQMNCCHCIIWSGCECTWCKICNSLGIPFGHTRTCMTASHLAAHALDCTPLHLTTLHMTCTWQHLHDCIAFAFDCTCTCTYCDSTWLHLHMTALHCICTWHTWTYCTALDSTHVWLAFDCTALHLTALAISTLTLEWTWLHLHLIPLNLHITALALILHST